MSTVDDSEHLAFPALLAQDGYMYLARDKLELYTHPRLMFSKTVNEAKSGSVIILDAKGRQSKIIDWTKVRPFGGVRMIGRLLLCSVFAKPCLSGTRQLTLDEFKKQVIKSVRGRYHYDSDRTPSEEIIEKIRAADSFVTALSGVELG